MQKSKSAEEQTLTVDECRSLDVPEDVGRMGSKGLLQFLKVQLKKTQEDHKKLVADFKTKVCIS